jgi:hypothetical protein
MQLPTGGGESGKNLTALYHAKLRCVKIRQWPVHPLSRFFERGLMIVELPFLTLQPKEHPMSDQSAKFPLGQTVATPNALAHIPNDEILNALSRHVRGDWGTLDKEDLESNEQALQRGGRLFSSYLSSQSVKFWIITECDRSVTTVLLPEDY